MIDWFFMKQETLIYTSKTDCQNTPDFQIWHENEKKLFCLQIQKDLPEICVFIWSFCPKKWSLSSKPDFLQGTFLNFFLFSNSRKLQQPFWVHFSDVQLNYLSVKNSDSHMSHPVAEDKRKSTSPRLLQVCMLWLVDWLGLQLVFELFCLKKRVSFQIFQPIRMARALSQNKMSTCTETALCALQFQLNFWNKMVSLSDLNLICKSKAVSNFGVKGNTEEKCMWSLISSEILEKMVKKWSFYWSSWGHGGLSEFA